MRDQAIDEVLAGTRSYDVLSDEQQAVVRAGWDQRIAKGLDSLDLVAEFEVRGEPYSELDADGEVVIRRPAESDAELRQRMVTAATAEERVAARREIIRRSDARTDEVYGDAVQNLEER